MTKDWIIAALERELEREETEAAAARDEIKQRGTWWAGSEIARLRVRAANEALGAASSTHERGTGPAHRSKPAGL